MPRAALLVLLPGLVATATAPAVARADGDRPTASVLGGRSAPPGKYPDVAAIYLPDQPECTGTLIAPKVVLTAGHCINPRLQKVVLGRNDLRSADGEDIPIAKQIAYPDAFDNYDLGVLILSRASVQRPRALATGWVAAEIVDGSTVSLVGFGATDADAKVFPDALQEAETTVSDADCSTAGVGCNATAQPAGELGAGGGGIDTCVGDSGGPMFITTSYGTFLAGVTSRVYSNATAKCSQGGIYVRTSPHAIDWIEDEAGIQIVAGPTPALQLIASPGLSDVGAIAVNDPHPDAIHGFALETGPAHGTAVVRSDGSVVYTPKGDFTGDDPFTVRVTDTSQADRSVVFTVDARSADSGGCRTGRAAGAPWALVLAAAALARRRRPALAGPPALR